MPFRKKVKAKKITLPYRQGDPRYCMCCLLTPFAPPLKEDQAECEANIRKKSRTTKPSIPDFSPGRVKYYFECRLSACHMPNDCISPSLILRP